jgi:hypothetical protein
MSTVIVNVPKKQEDFFNNLMKKFKFKSHAIPAKEMEETALAAWIEEGMKSKDIPLKELYKFFKKNGINA